MTQELGPLQQQWVDALRSGDYAQGRERLRTSGDKFCCLGVLCDIREPDGWDTDNHHWGQDCIPSDHIMEEIGLSYDGTAIGGGRPSLTWRNDEGGCTFAQIADELEQNAEAWFADPL